MRMLHLAACILPCLVSAQSWCPPGAQWNYSIMGLGLSGYVVRTYEGTALHQGMNAQRIHETGFQVQDWLPPEHATTPIDRYVYTTVVDSTLLIWSDGSPALGWDTLFRFDAEIGARWHPPGFDNYCNDGLAGMIMVVDTGHAVIDGITLRTWTMDYSLANGDPAGYDFNFTERLGYPNGFVLPPAVCIIFEYGESRNCYMDFEIGQNQTAWPFGCASVTAVSDNSSALVANPFPNPGTDHFTIMLPPGTWDVVVVDALGRHVLTTRSANDRVEVGASSLSPGLYLIRVGNSTPVKWLKE